MYVHCVNRQYKKKESNLQKNVLLFYRYCNARIIKFDKNGNVIKTFGTQNMGQRGM